MTKHLSIHDNEIKSIKLILSEMTLILETTFTKDRHPAEKTNVIFEEVLAYSFDEGGEQNILFEVANSSIEDFVDWYSSNYDTQKAFEYGFPIKEIKEPKRLKEHLKSKGYSCWNINASVGLDGFVIAKKMKISEPE